MCTLSSQEFQFILDRLSQFYIANEEFHDLLEETHYCIPLNNYLCFCYGADYTYGSETPRKVEIFQFQDKTSLFRSTLFYVPNQSKLFRIHSLMSFITLPVYKLIKEKTTYEDIHQMSTLILASQKFLVSVTKKKQILERLQSSLRLCEQSIKADGSLESSLPEQGNKK